MHLLQSGVDMGVIALWLGHENLQTTKCYVEADLIMKEQALQNRRQRAKPSRVLKQVTSCWLSSRRSDHYAE